MAFEKRYTIIAARSFVADGQSNGTIELASTASFKVKQKVVVTALGESNIELEIKAVFSDKILKVGPPSSNIHQITDISAYTVAKNAAILANEQFRPGITGDEIKRAVYDEEPTVAFRNVLVDKFGRHLDSKNPMPVNFVETWDRLETEFPSDDSELYTYKLDDNVVFTVLVVYENDSKNTIISIQKTSF